jgi:aminopeptidase N
MLRTPRWQPALLAACLCCLVLPLAPAFGQRGARRQPPAETAQPAPAAAAQPAQTAAQPAAPTEPLRTPGDRPEDIRDIRLDLRVDLHKKAIEGKATLQFRGLRPTRTINLDAVNFEVKQVTLARGHDDAAPVRYTYDGQKLRIDLGNRWSAGQEGTLTIAYRVENPTTGLHFFGPSSTEPDAPLQVWSHGEPLNNRHWIPCYDEPDQRQTTQVVATVPEGFEALSNGKLLERKDNPRDKTVTFNWRQDKPHPSYLVTLAVGQFDIVREEWDGLPVEYYMPRGHQAEATPTFAHTREMLAFFSQRFGIRYPWDKYAQVMAYQFGGGQENTSATTMTERILLDQRSLLDHNSDSIISHELAHQWWGDMVTCRDWSHLWLNEGFASYAEALWDEHQNGAEAYDYNMYRKAGTAIRGGKTRPIMDRRYTSPDAMFDARSYPKGAWVLHMLRKHVGDELFFKGIQRYGTENQFLSAETSDFRRCMERTTGRSLDRFFYDWLERAGNPDLEVTTEYLPDDMQVKVVAKQTQAGEPFHIPLRLDLYTAGKAAPTVLEQEMTEKELTLRIPVSGPPTRIDVDPEQAILTELKETKSRDLWRTQLLEGPNVPARLRAVQHFATSKTDEDRELLSRAFTAEKFHGVKTELATALGTVGGTVCRDALLQGLSHSDARIRRACVASLEKFGKDAAVLAVVKEIVQKGDPSYAVEGAALATYAKQGQKDAVALITPWLSKPSHDDILRGAALTALGSTQDPAVLDTLLTWTKPGKSRNARPAAMRGLTELVKGKKLSEAQQQRVVKLMIADLESNDLFVRFSILNALPELGPAAAAALPALDKLARTETRAGFLQFVKTTADKVRANAGTTPAAATEVTQLREEIKRLQADQEALRKRLDQYEKTQRRASASP